MMKTKFLFTMCAATLLAGCANEEFLSTPETNIDNRAKVEVNLAATMGEYSTDGASTRTIWEAGKYKWEAGDVIGACIVDATTAGTAAFDNIVSNYPFSIQGDITTPVETGSFATNTAVYEGTYVFYHGYQADLTTGRKMTVKFPVSAVVNPEKPLEHLTKDNFFVSPLIKIVEGYAYGAVNSIPVQFTSLYSGFAPTLKNATGEDIKVSKVEVKLNTGDFVIAGDINTVTTNVFGDIVDSDADDLAKTIKERRDAMRAATVNLYQGTADAEEKSKTITITMPKTLVAAGAELDVRMLFPAGTYAANELSMTVFTDKGIIEIPVSDKELVFNRDEFRTGSFDMETINSFPAEFIVTNEADWNYAVGVMNDNLTYYTNNEAFFNLKNDITLTDAAVIPAFAIYVDGTVTLKNEGGTFSFAEGSYFKGLVVDEKTTLNLGDKTFINELENNGIVNVLKGKTVLSSAAKADYTTWATDSKKAAGVSTFTTEEGSSIIVNGTLELGKAAAATLAAKTTTTIAKGGTLSILDNTVTNEGIINNNGKLKATIANAILSNEGVINLSADCLVQSMVATAEAVIVNNDNEALISLAAVKDVFVGNDGKATTTALVTNTNGTTSVAVTPASDFTVLKALNEVNSATISGSWDNTAIKKLDGATAIEALVLNNAKIDVKDNTATSFAEITDIKVMGKENAITNSAIAAVQFSAAATDLTIEKDAKLVVAKLVQFGNTAVDGGSTPTISVQGELDITGAVVGDITVGADEQSGSPVVPANTDAKVVINKDGYLTASASFATATGYANGAISNFGTVINNGTLNATTVTNEVPNKSLFQGNITKSDTNITTTEAGF